MSLSPVNNGSAVYPSGFLNSGSKPTTSSLKAVDRPVPKSNEALPLGTPFFLYERKDNRRIVADPKSMSKSLISEAEQKLDSVLQKVANQLSISKKIVTGATSAALGAVLAAFPAIALISGANGGRRYRQVE